VITIKKSLFFFSLSENWFGYQFKWSNIILPVCYRGLRNTNEKLYFGVRKNTNTVVLDINKPIEEIYSKFSTSHKRYIKKAESEGVKCIINSDRKTFIEFYNKFAISKNLTQVDVKRIDELNIEAWKCSFAIFNNQILATHSYLEDRDTGIVRLMESGSLRLDENVNATEIARANKLLHYYDIKYFNERGLKFYDFGGWDGIESLLYFKQSFGAEPINVFNYFTYTYVLKDAIFTVLKTIKLMGKSKKRINKNF
jgi:hypothetical protein